MSQHHKINGNLSLRSICYGMILRAAKKIGQSEIKSSRGSRSQEQALAPRVEFIEHLKL